MLHVVRMCIQPMCPLACVRACVRACVYLRMHGVRVRMRVQMHACVCVCARYNAQAAECDNIVATHFRVGADFAESVIILENFLRHMISTLKCTPLRASTLHAPTVPSKARRMGWMALGSVCTSARVASAHPSRPSKPSAPCRARSADARRIWQRS